MRIDERTAVARVTRVTLRELRVWVREGWVRPAQGAAGPMFDDLDLARIELLCDLRKEMALPAEAVPTVLALLDNLHRTRRDLRRLTRALEVQPREVRQAVLAALRQEAGGDG